MRQKIRRGIILLSLLLFPVTMNYLSPYVCIDGAMLGIVSGSLLLFAFLFVASVFFGRAWCGWLCPMAGLAEAALGVNRRNVNVKRLKIIRYCLFVIWFGVLLAMFVLAGGVKGIDPFHLTDNGISVNEPTRYIIYYSVLVVFIVLTFWLGKRGACQSICWMAPFMAGGYRLGRLLKIPQLRITADPSRCVQCGLCGKNCPMSIPVSLDAKEGVIRTSDCILCGECADSCPKNVLRYDIVQTAKAKKAALKQAGS